MRLTELQPRWLSWDGNPHAVLLFRCPCCRKDWLTCTLVPLTQRQQCQILAEQFSQDQHDGGDIVTCKAIFTWQATGVPDFDRLSITPSIDASSSLNWHGYIKNGEIV